MATNALTRHSNDTTASMDSSVQIFKPDIPHLVFTNSAAKKVYGLITEEGNLALRLRVFITGGGCSGFQYGFAFTEEKQEEDTVIEKAVAKKAGEKEGTPEDKAKVGMAAVSDQFIVQLLVDPMSLQYLLGAEIDYVEDIQGERFVIRNPNAATTCGCGSSFSA